MDNIDDMEKSGGEVRRILIIQRQDVEALNLAPYLSPLKMILKDRDAIIRRRQDVRPCVAGYNEDPRELCQIPEVRTFIARMDEEMPSWFYFIDPACGFMSVLLGCQSPLADVVSLRFTAAGVCYSRKNVENFLRRHFAKLNAFLDCHHLDDANCTVNKQIVGSVTRCLLGW